MDTSSKCCTLQFSLPTYWRITRSSIAGETLALADAFDNLFMVKYELQRMLGNDVPLLMLTDSKISFDIITRNRYTTETRLMIDVAVLRQAYNSGHIANNWLIKQDYNATDALIKVGPNTALNPLLFRGFVQHPVLLYFLSAFLFTIAKRPIKLSMPFYFVSYLNLNELFFRLPKGDDYVYLSWKIIWNCFLLVTGKLLLFLLCH